MVDGGKLVQKPGGWEGRFRCGPGPRRRALITVTHERDAESRARRMREVIRSLTKAGKVADACAYLADSALAPNAAAFNGISRAALDLAQGKGQTDGPATFRDVANLWLTGVLHDRFPGAFRKQSQETAANTLKTLEKHVMRHVGTLAIRNFTAKHFQIIMAGLPKELTARNKIARAVDVVLRGAVELELIAHNPIKRSAIPPARDPYSIAFTYLYPQPEEEALVRCAAIPIERRAFYGFMSRNGTRPSEAALLVWGDIDLDNGTVNLDHTKSDTPRFWMMDADVIAVLARLKPEGALATDLVFSHLASPSDRAAQLRRDLKTAGCTRPALGIGRTNPFKGKSRRPIRCHDLRATFVTVALASGWTEAQVKARTGHESDVMLARYKRRATNAVELGHGNWFAPLDECLWPAARPTRPAQVGHRVGQVISIQRKKAVSGSSSTTTDGVQVHAGTQIPAANRPPAGTRAPLGPPRKGGVGQAPDGAERDLASAIANATAAGKWRLAERLTVRLEGLIAAGLPKPR
jgi:integrase